MEKLDLLIKGAFVLPMNAAGDILENAAVGIDGQTIIEVGESASMEKKYHINHIHDAGQSIIMPGLINTHTHAAMVMFRGLADDLPLEEWLIKHIWPAEKKYVNFDFIKDGSDLACLEMIKAGITCFNDMYIFQDATAEAADMAGLRAVIGELVIDFPTNSAADPRVALEFTRNQLIKYRDSELISVAVAPHSVYTCSENTLKETRDFAKKNNLKIHIHLSETLQENDKCLKEKNQTPVEYLDSLNFLSNQVIAVHAVHLSANDLNILKKNGVSVSHNPASNMKLASGVSPLTKILEHGINASLGTDGAASNNAIDLLSDMRLAALLQKVSNLDPALPSAKQIVFMATINSAQALGKEKEIGSLEAGKKADLITIDFNKPHMVPLYNPYSHLVYCTNGGDVKDVLVNGKFLMKNRVVLTLEENKIISKAISYMAKIK